MIEQTSWPHSPPHFSEPGYKYILTAATEDHQHFFRQATELTALSAGLQKYIQLHGWKLLAWSVFSNHYHFVAIRPKGASSAADFIQDFHSRSAIYINQLHDTPGRRVWCNYWDSTLTYHSSFLARLNYVINNPVRHQGNLTKNV